MKLRNKLDAEVDVKLLLHFKQFLNVCDCQDTLIVLID